VKQLIQLISLVLIFFTIKSHASVNSCTNLFRAKVDSIQTTIGSQFSQSQRRIILAAVHELEKMIGPMNRPPKIEFEVGDDLPDPIMAEPYSEKIYFQPSFLKLSPKVFRSLIIHEIMHLIIFRNIKNSQGKILRDELLRTQDYLVAYTHVPFAELLCDTASVLLDRDPTVFKQFISETTDILTSVDPTFRDRFERVMDRPLDLSVRDFSIPYTDAKWDDYNPDDRVYNRFNQIRAYLFQRWISRLPKESNSVFFFELFRIISTVYQSNHLDHLIHHQGLPKSNTMLIEYMEDELKKSFPELS